MKSHSLQAVTAESGESGQLNTEGPNKSLEFLSNVAQKLLAEVQFFQDVEYEIKLKSLTDENGLIANRTKIDFYDEISRFESYLIKLALKQTEGCQSCAARLLNLKTSTLSNKLRQLNIHLISVVSQQGCGGMRHEHIA
jgi:DNA-binding NtrC family response regulator